MVVTFEIVLPVFGLIFCGYAVGRTPLLGREGVKGLNNFVYYVAIPVLLFRTLGVGEIPGTFDLDILFAYFGACLAMYALAAVIGRLAFSLAVDEIAVLGMGGCFSNSVMIGIPLILTAFGDAGMMPILLIVALNSSLLFLITTVILEAARGHRAGEGRILAQTFASLVRNPIILSLAAGLMWRATGWHLPAPADRFTELMSGAAAPTALFAMGASLAEFRIAGNLTESLTMTALKLVAHPLLVWALARFVFHLPPTWTAVATITAALPVGVNVFVFAQRYETYVQRSASAVVISTALAIFSVSALLVMWAPGG